MRPAKKIKPHSGRRVRAGALLGLAILAPVLWAGVAEAAPPRQATGQFGVSITILPPGRSPGGEVAFKGEVIGKGSNIDASGDVVGYYAPGCFVVQLPGWASPVVACGADSTLIPIGRRVRVRGVVERTVRQRQGPFLDVVPLIRGSVEVEGER